ncbi:hypothetical protein D8674_037968 [Pyrus ussuriensis x Pyrus communis]|uniref:Uncharacterized protein n=1 Tax=Pyrus ussuriensis x Pyrus communis TaxID=2448454 RepID=A0A5N5FNB3_9ROSA|nr:hypothetical protein D8674_037968 [Pyrus ussuriensis x Pyrus communis]
MAVHCQRNWSKECNPNETKENSVLESNQNLNPILEILKKRIKPIEIIENLEYKVDLIIAAITIDTAEITIADGNENAKRIMEVEGNRNDC